MGLLSVLIENWRLNNRLSLDKINFKRNTNILNEQECVFNEMNIASLSHLGVNILAFLLSNLKFL